MPLRDKAPFIHDRGVFIATTTTLVLITMALGYLGHATIGPVAWKIAPFIVIAAFLYWFCS